MINHIVVKNVLKSILPGAVARSEACPLGMQAAPSSIFFRGDLVISTAILPLPLIQVVRMCTKYW